MKKNVNVSLIALVVSLVFASCTEAETKTTDTVTDSTANTTMADSSSTVVEKVLKDNTNENLPVTKNDTETDNKSTATGWSQDDQDRLLNNCIKMQERAYRDLPIEKPSLDQIKSYCLCSMNSKLKMFGSYQEMADLSKKQKNSMTQAEQDKYNLADKGDTDCHKQFMETNSK